MSWYPRSEWTRSKPGCSTSFSGVRGVAIHYPGGNISDKVAAGDKAATAAYLEQTRASQMGSTKYDYCDIEYSLAVDRKGNIWTLRGLGVRTGANGTSEANAAYPSIFVLVGLHTNRKPTRAQKAGIRRAVKKVRAKYPGANQIRGHREFVATSCPGSPLWDLIQSGDLEPVLKDRVLKKLRRQRQRLRDRLNTINRRIRRRMKKEN